MNLCLGQYRFNVAMIANNRIVSIIDDDPSTTLFFREAVKGFTGITVVDFTDPILALEHFQKYDYAYVLVICDFKMPGLDGIKLLKNIKESNRFVRTILITAAFTIDDNLLLEYTKKRIIDGFVQKPIGLYDFLKEVETQLSYYENQKKFPS
ncbi:MAG TPA: response regulator [Nitrososphaeraceae archaeon]|nr:response regulator [Nitrososphaeraceae archaeon]